MFPFLPRNIHIFKLINGNVIIITLAFFGASGLLEYLARTGGEKGEGGGGGAKSNCQIFFETITGVCTTKYHSTTEYQFFISLIKF